LFFIFNKDSEYLEKFSNPRESKTPLFRGIGEISLPGGREIGEFEGG